MIYRYLTLAILAWTFLAGCSEEWEQAPQDSGKRIRLGAEFRSLTKVSEYSFDKQDSIGVFVTEYTGDIAPELNTSGNYADNVLFVYTGSELQTENGLYYPVYNNVDIYGYHPYRENVVAADSLIFSVRHDQQTEAAFKASDFVWAKLANVAANNSVVNMTFSHRMSKVEVVVHAGDGIPDLTGMKLSLNGVVCSGKVDLRNGTVKVSGEEAAGSVVTNPVMQNVTEQRFRAILFPQTVKEGVYLFEIALNGKKYTYKVPAGGQIFGSGKEQTYEFILNAFRKELQLKSASVTDWVSNGNDVVEQMMPDVSGREALMALYNATGGAEWTNRTNWGTDAELSEWYGVTVKDNEITEIVLPANNLKGALPKELAALNRLERLVLNDNVLSDTLPDVIGRMLLLRELNLANNSLTGKIPASFGDLRKLDVLDLSHNRLTGLVPYIVSLLPAYDSKKVALQYNEEGAEIVLEVEGNELIEGEKYIGDLEFKSQAEINTFAAKGYSEILGNVTIRKRGYDGSDIANVPVFAGLKKVHGNLDGYNNSSFPDLAYVGGNLKGREELWTAENTDRLVHVGGELNIYGTDISGFNGLTETAGLYISCYREGVDMSVNGFRNIKKLNGLFITGSYYTAAINTVVQGFDRLAEVKEELKLNHLEVIPEFQNLKICGNITLDDCGKENSVYNGFTALDSVSGNLNIGSENKFVELPSFPSLRYVRSDININNSYITKVAGFESLQDADDINISGGQLTEISGFNNLESINSLSLNGKQLNKVVGFKNLTEVDQLRISAPLTEMSDFPALKQGDITIEGTLLEDISCFNAFTGDSYYSSISIIGNSKLKDISGFNSYNGGRYNYDKNIVFKSNVLLEKVSGFTAVDTLQSFTVSGCYSLTALPLVDRLKEIEYLTIENNYSLTVIPAFSALNPETKLRSLTFTGNTALEDFTPLKSAIYENTNVTISNNKYNPTKEDIMADKGKPEQQP